MLRLLFGLADFLDRLGVVVPFPSLFVEGLWTKFRLDIKSVSHEFGHISLQQIRDFAIRHKIKRLLVTHIHHDWDTAVDEMRRVLSDGYKGELFIGTDGMRIPLDSPEQ